MTNLSTSALPGLPGQLPLGKKLGVVHDRRTFRMARLLDVDRIHLPKRHKVGGSLGSVPLFGNDEYGDCVFASQCHAVVTMERSSSQHDLVLEEGDALAAYAEVTGFDPARPSTDNGAYELDGLNHWRTVGIGTEKDGSRHQIHAFAAVDWKDHAQVMGSHYEFGGLKVCAALPRTANVQMRRGEDWTPALGNGPDTEPGSWGGHSMYSFGFDYDRGLCVWTWGRPQWMSWPWVAEYVDEAYAVISEDYVRKGGKTPQGFDLDRLDALLKALEK